jgi:hypothetical protein
MNKSKETAFITPYKVRGVLREVFKTPDDGQPHIFTEGKRRDLPDNRDFEISIEPSSLDFIRSKRVPEAVLDAARIHLKGTDPRILKTLTTNAEDPSEIDQDIKDQFPYLNEVIKGYISPKGDPNLILGHQVANGLQKAKREGAMWERNRKK